MSLILYTFRVLSIKHRNYFRKKDRQEIKRGPQSNYSSCLGAINKISSQFYLRKFY